MATLKSYCGKYEIYVDDSDAEMLIAHASNQQNKEGLWSVKVGNNNLYAVSNSKGFEVKMHRLIMSATDGQQIDHINGNGLDNRKDNLRFATSAQNCQNREKLKGKSLFKGVTVENGRFRSTIWIRRKKVFLGMYEKEEHAAIAYNFAAQKLYGEFAKINSVLSDECAPEIEKRINEINFNKYLSQ